MNNIPSEIAKKIFKDTLIRKGYNTINTTISNIESDLKASLTEPITTTINSIASAPGTLKHELKRQSYHEASNLFNINNYDYFEEYYNSYNKRFDPTPQPNLAEIF